MAFLIDNPTGKDAADISVDSSAIRVGRRIRKIRETKGLSQAALGTKIGLNADRIQKYENGQRKPRYEMIKLIASALEVNPFAIIDPEVSSFIGTMYALFELEDKGLKFAEVDGKPYFHFDDEVGSINGFIQEWRSKQQQIQDELENTTNGEVRNEILKEYLEWKWTFPKSLIDINKKQRRSIIQAQIRLLEDQLKALEEDD